MNTTIESSTAASYAKPWLYAAWFAGIVWLWRAFSRRVDVTSTALESLGYVIGTAGGVALLIVVVYVVVALTCKAMRRERAGLWLSMLLVSGLVVFGTLGAQRIESGAILGVATKDECVQTYAVTAGSESGARIAYAACSGMFGASRTQAGIDRAVCVLPQLKEIRTDLGARTAWSACQPSAPASAAPPAFADPASEALAPAAPVAYSPTEHWRRLVATWKATNPEFVADPERVKVMEAAILAVEDEHKGMISDGRLIALAEDRAFIKTGWKFRDSVAWNAEWKRLLAQWGVQNQRLLQDPGFAERMNAAVDELIKEQPWPRPSDLLAAAEQRVIEKLRVSNDQHIRATQAAERAARKEAARSVARSSQPPDDRERNCYQAHEAASATPPFGSIAVYAQWQKANQAKLDACIASVK